VVILLHSSSSLVLSWEAFWFNLLQVSSAAVFFWLSWNYQVVTWALLLPIAFSTATFLVSILAFLNLYDSSIAWMAQVLAAAISSLAFSFSTPVEVELSRSFSFCSLPTLLTSLECSAVLLSSPSDWASSWAALQKVLVALTNELSKNFCSESQKHYLSWSGAGSAPSKVAASQLTDFLPLVPVTANESLMVPKKSSSFLSLSNFWP